MRTLARILPFPSPTQEEVFVHGYDIVLARGPLRVSADEEEPATTRALLMCERSCNGPVPHDYKGRRCISTPKSPSLAYDEFVYACRQCGHERVWGTETVEK